MPECAFAAERAPMVKKRRPVLTRDFFLFGTGLILTIHETVVHKGAERPYLLMLFAGMMGLPVFLRQDEKKNGKDGGTS